MTPKFDPWTSSSSDRGPLSVTIAGNQLPCIVNLFHPNLPPNNIVIRRHISSVPAAPKIGMDEQHLLTSAKCKESHRYDTHTGKFTEEKKWNSRNVTVQWWIRRNLANSITTTDHASIMIQCIDENRHVLLEHIWPMHMVPWCKDMTKLPI